MKLNKIKITLLLTVLLISTLAIAIPVGAVVTTFYVDVDATGASDGTSWTDAYTTITAALDDGDLAAGDIILVAAGTYAENIDLDVDDLILKSADGAATTFIEPSGFDATILVTAAGITIGGSGSGFTISSDPGSRGCIYADETGGEGITVQDNILKSEEANGHNARGMWFDSLSEDALITENAFEGGVAPYEGFNTGILVADADGATISDNVVEDVSIYYCFLTFKAERLCTDEDETWYEHVTLAATTINDVTVSGNDITGVRWGIKIAASTKDWIKDGLYAQDLTVDEDGLLIQDNFIYETEIGVVIDEDEEETGQTAHIIGEEYIAINLNDFETNSEYAVENGQDEIDAESNWWGDPAGPNMAGTIDPVGIGDKILGTIDYIPWLSAPKDDEYTLVEENPALDEEWYAIGGLVSIVVCDGTENLRPLVKDTIEVIATSSGGTTGIEDQITLDLMETGFSTGVYEGSFTLVDESPGANDLLVEDESTVTVSYYYDGTDEVSDTAEIDASDPTITIIEPINNANITDTTPLVKAEIDDNSDIDVAWMELDGKIVDTTPDNDILEYQVPSMPLELRLDEGEHIVEVTVTDIAGNLATESWSFTVDITEPTCVISMDPLSPVNATEVKFLFDFDKDMLDSPDPTIDGNATEYMTLVEEGWKDVRTYSANYTVDSTTDFNGSVLLDCTGAEDMAGNVMIEANMTYYIDNMVPTAPDNLNATLGATSVVLTWDASEDEGSGMELYNIYKDDVKVGSVEHPITTFTETGLNAADTFDYQVKAVDFAGNAEESTVFEVEFVPGDVIEWDISLDEGWNLVSLPLIPDDSAIEVVLVDILEDVESVWSYNEVTGLWLSYAPGTPSDLTDMVDGDGYWVRTSTTATLTVHGVEMPDPPSLPPDYDLVAGWNLIGYKALEEMTATAYLGAALAEDSIRIYGFDDGSYFGLPLDSNMEPGLGYWIAMSEAGTIYP